MKTMKRVAGSGSSLARFHHQDTVVDATSDAVKIENTGREVLVTVTPGTDATVEFSLSSEYDINQGNGTWHAWPHGAVTEFTTDGVSSGVTALRLVSTGSSVWEISQ